MEQLSIDIGICDHDKERAVYEAVREKILAVMSTNNTPQEWLSFQKMAQCSSVSIKHYVIFRIKIGVKVSWIEFPYHLIRGTDRAGEGKTQRTGYVRFYEEPLRLIVNEDIELGSIVQKAIDRMPCEFDCCNLFNACSDALQCIHDNKDFAAGCGYKRILRQGRVFYGKNRNID